MGELNRGTGVQWSGRTWQISTAKIKSLKKYLSLGIQNFEIRLPTDELR